MRRREGARETLPMCAPLPRLPAEEPRPRKRPRRASPTAPAVLERDQLREPLALRHDHLIALRRISPRSRGLRSPSPRRPPTRHRPRLGVLDARAPTEVILFSVAGSITSKRAPSDALRHLPRSTGRSGHSREGFHSMGHLSGFLSWGMTCPKSLSTFRDHAHTPASSAARLDDPVDGRQPMFRKCPRRAAAYAAS